MQIKNEKKKNSEEIMIVAEDYISRMVKFRAPF